MPGSFKVHSHGPTDPPRPVSEIGEVWLRVCCYPDEIVVYTDLSGILVKGSGANVWDALASAFRSYTNWLEWYNDGCSQGAAERIWGEPQGKDER